MIKKKVPAKALSIGDQVKFMNVVYRITELERTAEHTRVLLLHIKRGSQTFLELDNFEKVYRLDVA